MPQISQITEVAYPLAFGLRFRLAIDLFDALITSVTIRLTHRLAMPGNAVNCPRWPTLVAGRCCDRLLLRGYQPWSDAIGTPERSSIRQVFVVDALGLGSSSQCSVERGPSSRCSVAIGTQRSNRAIRGNCDYHRLYQPGRHLSRSSSTRTFIRSTIVPDTVTWGS